MREAYAATGVTTNSGGAETCTAIPKSCTPSALQVRISEIIKQWFPKGMKPWAHLCEWFGIKERAAKHRLANSASYTIEELQILLHQENGYEILDALMAQAKPRWWAMIEQTMAIARARHHQELARQEVLALESAPLSVPTRRKTIRIANADQQITSARARQETALGVLLADGGRTVRGAMVSATASAPRFGGRRG